MTMQTNSAGRAPAQGLVQRCELGDIANMNRSAQHLAIAILMINQNEKWHADQKAIAIQAVADALRAELDNVAYEVAEIHERIEA